MPTQTSRCLRCCANAGCPGATPPSRPSWPTGRCAVRARTTRCWPLASTGHWPRSTYPCCSYCDSVHTSCSPCACPTHAAVSATVELARAVLGDGRSKFVNAVLRKVSARGPLGLARRAHGWARCRATPWRCGTRTPGGSSRRWLRRWAVRSTRRSWRRRWLPTTSRLRHPRGPAGPLDRGGAADRRGGSGRSVVAVRRGPRQWGRPRRTSLRSGAVAPECRTRAASSSRSPPPRCPSRAVTRGGSTCAPARAARPPSLQAWRSRGRPGSRQTKSRRTVPSSSRRAVAGQARGDGRRRSRRTLGAGGLRPRARRCPVHRPRRLASPPRGALASPALRRRPGWSRCSGELLAAALEAARPGGVVVYATCSPVVRGDARGRGRLGRGRSRRAGRRTPRPPWRPRAGLGPDAQLWPHVHGTDAMYLAALRRL